MSHGPIFLWQLIYQAKTDVINLGQPETVSVDRWLQPLSLPAPSKPDLHASRQPFQPYAQPNPVVSIPWFNWLSEPVRVKPGLAASEQQVLALTEAAPFPETVTESRWHQPWSEPVRSRIFPVALQSTTAFTAVIAAAASVDGWGAQLSTPQRQLVGLGTAQQQFFAYDPAVFVPSIDGWNAPLTEPPKPKTSLAAAAQQFLATSLFFTAAAPPVDSWGAQLSIPQRRLLGLPTPQQQFLAYAEGAPFPETVSEDRWHVPWSEPVRTKPGLAASEQQAAAFVATVAAATPSVAGWYSPFVEVPKSRQSTTWHDALGFVALVPTATVIEDWPDLIGAKPGLSAGSQQANAFVPFISTTTPSIDGWGSPFAEVPKPKAGTTAACQQFFAFDPAVFVSAPDAWMRPWSEPPQPKTSINVAAQQALAYDPAVFAPIAVNWWFTPFEVPPLGKQSLSVQQQQALAWDPNTIFGESVVVSEWFRNFDPPPPPRAGLSAAQQQALGWNANVIFAENIFMSAWFAEYSNPVRTLTGHSIPAGFDTGSIPPFPIPNPPQTQAKFTVSGPSVSDLFPVSGVVYPYAPETRKTVP